VCIRHITNDSFPPTGADRNGWLTWPAVWWAPDSPVPRLEQEGSQSGDPARVAARLPGGALDCPVVHREHISFLQFLQGATPCSSTQASQNHTTTSKLHDHAL
jgi:hypothetical protein